MLAKGFITLLSQSLMDSSQRNLKRKSESTLLSNSEGRSISNSESISVSNKRVIVQDNRSEFFSIAYYNLDVVRIQCSCSFSVVSVVDICRVLNETITTQELLAYQSRYRNTVAVEETMSIMELLTWFQKRNFYACPKKEVFIGWVMQHLIPTMKMISCSLS